MRTLFQPLLFFLARSTEQMLIHQIEIFQLQLELTRKRVPQQRIFLDADEKRQLMELGQKLGTDVRHSLSIVHYRTYQRWLSKEKDPDAPKKMGRPRKPRLIRELILRIAEETGWGYTRILGELKKMRIFSICRSTVINILKENGHDPGPRRGKGSWDEFLMIHAETLWQCDFFSKRIWTPTGLRHCFVLAFLHVGTRRVFVTDACYRPNAEWMKVQAEAFLEHVCSSGLDAKQLIHDWDGKFDSTFDAILEKGGIEVKRVGPQAPNMNAFAERWIQSIQQECLDHFIVCGEQHFNYLISEYVDYYHALRPHQSLGNRPLTGNWPAEEKELLESEQIVCHTRLGGLLRHYERKAA